MQAFGQRVYRSGSVEVDVARRFVRQEGEVRTPRPRTFDLLVYLIQHRDRVVSREELQAALWPDTTVTSNSLTQCVNEARKLFDDDPREPRYIRTVAKAGYQFIHPVEEVGGYLEEITSVEVDYEDHTSPAAIPLTALPAAPRRRWLARAGIAAVSIVAVAATLSWIVSKPSRLAGSVVILPFENHSASPDLDWLREGLPDMLITNLSRAPGMNVLGREQVRSLLATRAAEPNNSTAFERAMAWGRQHGAELVAAGSFARLGDKIRVAVQLYRSSDGSMRASRSFTADRPEQIISHIDLVSIELSGALGHPIKPHDRQAGLSILMTSNIEAYRYYTLGLEKADALLPAEAIACFQKAADLDPEFAMAHARIGYTYTSIWGKPAEAKPSLERAFRMSNRLRLSDRLLIAAWYALANHDYDAAIRAYRQLMESNPRDVEAYIRLGSLLGGEQRTREAIDVLDKAVVIDPDAAWAWNVLSGVNARAGKGEAAVLAAQRYVALSPGEANAWDTMGLALHVAGKLEDAEQAYRRALSLKPGFRPALLHAGDLSFQRGRYEEAMESFRSSLENAISPRETGRGYCGLALTCLRRGRSAEAFANLEFALRAASDDTSALSLLSLEAGDLARAKQLVQIDYEGNDRGRRAQRRIKLVALGRIAVREGRSAEGLELLRQALREEVPVWTIEWLEDARGDAYVELGRYAEAAREYERALARFPQIASTHEKLAQVYSKLGKIELACAQYRHFNGLWKGIKRPSPAGRGCGSFE